MISYPLTDPIINIQCGQLSLIRTTGLVPPRDTQPLPTTCTYRINAINLLVCQMRLDFTQFSIGEPTVDPNDPNAAFPKCNGAHLKVGDVTLCGENSGQHGEIANVKRSGRIANSVPLYSLHSNQPTSGRASADDKHRQQRQWERRTSELENCGAPVGMSFRSN